MSSSYRFDAGFVLSGEIARLAALLADLRRIANGEQPTPDKLANAPLLLDYSGTYRPVRCLRGDVIGHPCLGNRNIVTTELWALSLGGRWARSYSRFYRLGNPRDLQVPL